MRQAQVTLLLILWVLSIAALVATAGNLSNYIFLRLAAEKIPLVGILFALTLALYRIKFRQTKNWAVQVVLLLGALLCTTGKIAWVLLDPSDERLVYRAISGSQEYEALVIERNAGATTAYSYIVVIRELNALLPRELVVFESYMEPIPEQFRFLEKKRLEIITDKGDVIPFVLDTEHFDANRKLLFYRGKPQSR
ncbi:hypothetical protein [Stigmatella aurantiaca]|nr:hypothetical protein [Stigmatella aurantiaca]